MRRASGDSAVNTGVRLAGFATGLALVFTAAVGVGYVVGPVGTVSAAPAHEHSDAAHADPAAGAVATGLSASQDGYVLQLAQPVLAAGGTPRFGFAVLAPDGQYLRDYTDSHGEPLHLILARRDLTGFQHLHPTRDARGRWFTPLRLDRPGSYKVFADFVPAGRTDAVVLAADVTVPGPVTPAPIGEPVRTVQVDGYTVTLAGTLLAGRSSALTATVQRGDEPVVDLQPYLAAYGHLVALRAADLAYLHVHPTSTAPTDRGPEIRFAAEVPSVGTYRLFLQFRHDGAVHTATFTLPGEAP